MRDSFAVSMAIILSVYMGFFYAINARGIIGPAEGRVTDRIVYQPGLSQEIILGLPNWPSAQVRAHVLAGSLEELFEKQIVCYPGSTDDILSAMGRRTSRVHLHPEVWTENVSQHIRRSGLALDRVTLSAPVAVGRQGLCINAPGRALMGEAADIDQVFRPEIVAGFDHEGDGKGEIWYGQINWE